MKFRQTVAVMIAAVALTADAFALSSQVLNVPAGSDASRQVALASVTRKRIAAQISATAIIEPDARAVAQIASRIPARVVSLTAEPGQSVVPGQPLAILSSMELGQAKTEYLKARSLESIMSQHLKREQDLYAKKIAPMKDLLEARAQHDTALAQYKAARETLRLLIPRGELDSLNWTSDGAPLSDFPLTSPIAGTLVKRDLIVGSMIDRNDRDPLKVINLDRVWVLANVFEHDLSQLAVGNEAEVKVDAYPGKLFDGRVAYIADEIDRRTRTVQARIEVPNQDHLLKPGMFAQALIEGGSSREALVAPDSAIYEVEDQKVVFVAAGTNRFALRPVRLGVAGGGVVEILSGLHQGERVVSSGGLALKSLLTNQAE